MCKNWKDYIYCSQLQNFLVVDAIAIKITIHSYLFLKELNKSPKTQCRRSYWRESIYFANAQRHARKKIFNTKKTH